jgi:hypothetical protein
MYALCIPLDLFKVGSHILRIETNHQIDHSGRICQLCYLREVETKEHFIFYYPVYYEIQNDSTVFSKSSNQLAISLGTPTRDAWSYTCKRPSISTLSSSNQTVILDQLPPNGSLPFLWCSQLGAPSGRWIAIMSLTPYQW